MVGLLAAEFSYCCQVRGVLGCARLLFLPQTGRVGPSHPQASILEALLTARAEQFFGPYARRAANPWSGTAYTDSGFFSAASFRSHGIRHTPSSHRDRRRVAGTTIVGGPSLRGRHP